MEETRRTPVFPEDWVYMYELVYAEHQTDLDIRPHFWSYFCPSEPLWAPVKWGII